MTLENPSPDDRSAVTTDRSSTTTDRTNSKQLSAKIWRSRDMQSSGDSDSNSSTAGDALPGMRVTGGEQTSKEQFEPSLSQGTTAAKGELNSGAQAQDSSTTPPGEDPSIPLSQLIPELTQLVQELTQELGQLTGSGGDSAPQAGSDSPTQTGATPAQTGGDTLPNNSLPAANPSLPAATAAPSEQPTTPSGDSPGAQNPYGGSLAGWLNSIPGADTYQPASFDNPLPSDTPTTGNASTDAAIVSNALNQATTASGTGFNAFGSDPDTQAQLDPAFKDMEAASNDPNFNQDLINAMVNSGMVSNAEAALNAGQNIEGSGGGDTNHLPLDGGQNDWAGDIAQTVQNLENQGIAPTIDSVVNGATAAFNQQIESAFTGQGQVGEAIEPAQPGVAPWTAPASSSNPAQPSEQPAAGDQQAAQNPYGGSLAGWLNSIPGADAYQPASFDNPLPSNTVTTGNASTDAAIVSNALNQATQSSGTGFNAFGSSPNVQSQLDPAFAAMEKASNDPNFNQDIINAMQQSGMVSNAEAALNAGQNIEGSGGGDTGHLPLDGGQPMYALDINQAVQDAEAQGLDPTIANVIPEATSLFNQQIMSSFSGDGW